MLRPQENRYLPVFVLLTLIITIQSFLIGEDQRQSDFDRPAMSLTTPFVSRPQTQPTNGKSGAGPTGELILSRAAYSRADSLTTPVPVAATAGPATVPGSMPAIQSTGSGCLTTCEIDFGDNIWRIAKRYAISPEAILKANRMTSPALTPGQVLVVPVPCGPIALPGYDMYTIKANETAIDVAFRLGVPLIDLVRENDLASLYEIPPGTVLRYKKASAAPMARTNAAKAASRSRPKRSGIESPLYGQLSDRFGWRRHPIFGEIQFHTGVDIQGRHGQHIRAAQDGRVIFAGWLKNYGRTIVMRHAGGLTTRYAHCSSLIKKAGDMVRRGERIAQVGTSGVTTGPHLHFEVRKDGNPIDPLRFIGRASSGRAFDAG